MAKEEDKKQPKKKPSQWQRDIAAIGSNYGKMLRVGKDTLAAKEKKNRTPIQQFQDFNEAYIPAVPVTYALLAGSMATGREAQRRIGDAAKFAGGVANQFFGKKPSTKDLMGKANAPRWSDARDYGTAPRSEDNYRTFDEIFQDYMDRYGERQISTGGGFDASPYNQAAERAAAIYRQLENSFGPDAEALKQLFAKTASDYAANADRARSSIQGAYAGTNAERMRQLQALGIEEAAGNVGAASAADEANALSNVARMLEASQGRNTGYENAALTLNEQMKAVSRLQGADAQTAIQRAMADAMANAAKSSVSTVGMSPSEIITMSNAAMKEQDKMNKALQPEPSQPTSAQIQFLFDKAAELYPDDPATQRAWVNAQRAVL